jgi:DNA-directed DNA polymerase III PolC
MGSRSMSFIEQFTNYEGCVPPGVRLPNIKIEDKYYKMLECSPDVSNYEFLRKLCHKGVYDRGIDKFDNKKEYFDRAKSELAILEELGFIDYILLNWDILNFCHENDIPTGPGRGSAAGSLVLYLIGVTNVDPVEYNLFFERFVSKSRARKIEQDGITYLDGSLLADVDNDIAYERRAEVIDYIERKHPARTAKILTLNTLSGKLCVKECGKIVGEFTEQQVNEVSDTIPKRFGVVVPLRNAIEESEKFTDWAAQNAEVFNIALKLEGLNKNTGVHPSGIAISFDTMTDICPIQTSNDGALVTGYDMNWVSELMVKFDILGLRTLSVIYDVCKSLGIDCNEIDLHNTDVFKPLQALRAPHGLFQLESDTNYRVCKKIKPQSLEQLSAVVAIGRPGALEFLDNYATYVETEQAQVIHEFFSDVLDYTGGIPLYQEQLMQMAVKVGFTLDEAEQLRRIVGKKKVDQMPAWKAKIEEKVSERGLSSDIGTILWSVAEDSANYSFNKSHSLSYSVLAAWTTYLKFNHPQQFFLSLLKMTKYEPAPQEEISKITKELSHFGIKLLCPDLAKSKMDFAIEGKNIRFGLNSIKGVSEKSLQSLQDFRSSETPTKYDIFLAAKQAGLNIGVLSALIQAGALESKGSNRSLMVLEAQAFNLLTDREKRNFILLGDKYEYKLLNCIADAKKGELVGDDGKPLMKESRFKTFKKKYDVYKSIYDKNKEYESFANWYFETELLGYSHSCNLKECFVDSYQSLCDSRDLHVMQADDKGKFIGVVEDCIKRTSRNGNKYMKLSIADEYGRYDAMLLNSRRGNYYDRYFEANKKTPVKKSIIVAYGRKSEDIVFLDSINIMDEKIYMKMSDVK